MNERRKKYAKKECIQERKRRIAQAKSVRKIVYVKKDYKQE